MPTAQDKTKPVAGPFLGLFLDRPPLSIPPQGFAECNNVAIRQGRISSYNMGWTRYGTFQLNGTVTLIDVFTMNSGSQFLLMGTPTDLYNYNNGSPVFLTPSYSTGTIALTNNSTAVTGTGTNWITHGLDGSGLVPLRAGDMLYVGAANQNSPGATWLEIASVNSDTSITLQSAYTGATSSGDNYTIRHLFAGNTNTNIWDSETFPHSPPNLNDIWMATNGTDYPVSWDGSATFCIVHPEFGFTAHQLFRYHDMMIYANLLDASGDSRPYSFANSDVGAPFNVGNTATGVAGEYIVTDNEASILTMGVLADTLVFYTTFDVIAAQIVSGTTFWSFREIIRGWGPIGPRMFANFPDHHRFVGKDTEYYYNGYYLMPIGSQLWRGVLPSFDQSRANTGFCIFDEAHNDLIWCLPLTTDPTQTSPSTAFVEHYLEINAGYFFRPFTQRDFPFTAGCIFSWPNATNLTFNTLTNGFNTYTFQWNASIFTSNFPLTLVGDANGYVYSLYTSDTQNGAAYTSFVTFGPRLTINERSRGLVKRVYPFVEYSDVSYNLTVQLSMFDYIGGSTIATSNPTLIDTQTTAINETGNRFTTHFRRGRLMQLTFSTPGPSQPWVLDGYDVDVVPGGVR